MPVSTTSTIHFSPGAGTPPGAPTAVTSVTADASAIISFRPPASSGDGPVTSWTVTPYISGTSQAPTTVAAASAGTITASDGNTYRQVTVTGLANSTAYTFTVKASSSFGTGAESAASGENTPLAGLVFGDDFGGPAAGPIDPEWWLLNVSSTSDESDYYRPDHVSVDGSGHLVLLATGDAYGGKPYTSGCVQNNTRAFLPSAGNTMTFETRAQICPGCADGMWPAPWLAGTGYQQQFKTDQNMNAGWDDTTHAEIDIAEWYWTDTTDFLCNVYASATSQWSYNGSTDLSAAQHIYRCDYKPGVSVSFWLDGTQIHSETTAKPTGSFFFMWFQQIRSGVNPSFPQRTYVDYVRIFDRNLG